MTFFVLGKQLATILFLVDNLDQFKLPKFVHSGKSNVK